MKILRFIFVPTLVLGCIPAATLRGQDAAPAAYATWSKLELSPEIRTFKERMRDGASLEAADKKFLEERVLPQLGLEDNRATIERVRRRIREWLIADIGLEKTQDDMNKTVLDAMSKLARDQAVEFPVQVNAMLLLGDLRAKDGKPWPQAVDALATAASDPKLPMALRIATLAGLAKHVEAANVKAVDNPVPTPLSKSALTAIQAILVEPLANDNRIPQDWLVSRAVMLVPAIARPASNELLGRLTKILADPVRAIDVRVRTAAVLGTITGKKSEKIVPAMVDSIRGLAILSLETEQAAAEQQRFEIEYRSFVGGEQVRNAEEPALQKFISEQTCRRAAWRLTTLADALLSVDGKSGLAMLLDGSGDARGSGDAKGSGGANGSGDAKNSGDAAKTLAACLRAGGASLDSHPDEQSLQEALAALKQSDQPAAGPDTPDANTPPVKSPRAPATPQPDNPFGS